MQIERKELEGYYYHIAREENIAWGFTEKDFPIELLFQLFPGTQLKFFKQIHSDIIIKSSEIMPDSQGDGIIVDEENTLAIIKTADCVPLFFWEPGCSFAGILHIGWRGFHKGIQNSLFQHIKEMGVTQKNMRFVMGPAIEGSCYEVGEDLYEKFARHTHRDQVFASLANGKYHLNLAKGIFLSLQAQGIKKNNIINIDICTRCNWRQFPSYRKNGKTGKRIINFLTVNK